VAIVTSYRMIDRNDHTWADRVRDMVYACFPCEEGGFGAVAGGPDGGGTATRRRRARGGPLAAPEQPGDEALLAVILPAQRLGEGGSPGWRAGSCCYLEGAVDGGKASKIIGG
jgi:hypothetical protein